MIRFISAIDIGYVIRCTECKNPVDFAVLVNAGDPDDNATICYDCLQDAYETLHTQQLAYWKERYSKLTMVPIEVTS